MSISKLRRNNVILSLALGLTLSICHSAYAKGEVATTQLSSQESELSNEAAQQVVDQSIFDGSRCS